MNLKSPDDIKKMAHAGSILAKVLQRVRKVVKPGVRTKDLDELANKLVLSYKARPAFLGYVSGGRRYPASLCVSVNEEIVHGLPSDRVLAVGDVVGLDFGVIYDGWYADSAITLPVGPVHPQAARLLAVTERALQIGIEAARVGSTVGDIGHAIQVYAEHQGFSVVRDLVGHGIGRALHEDPQVPNFGNANEGAKLQAGMVIAIEPMLSAGGKAITLADDGWTYKTADESLSAHFEHTIAITKKGPKVLTR